MPYTTQDKELKDLINYRILTKPHKRVYDDGSITIQVDDESGLITISTDDSSIIVTFEQLSFLAASTQMLGSLAFMLGVIQDDE